jgi:hypothetical protein
MAQFPRMHPGRSPLSLYIAIAPWKSGLAEARPFVGWMAVYICSLSVFGCLQWFGISTVGRRQVTPRNYVGGAKIVHVTVREMAICDWSQI